MSSQRLQTKVARSPERNYKVYGRFGLLELSVTYRLNYADGEETRLVQGHPTRI